ncbi:uncharacterized protein LOC123692896 isoform X2 [Colias croceus]|uniref:uncharacterized protein LOC123692896 isoform X2 n=1 Tax=Colias crocea TaxID=72248 RepID=UPI001E27D478|nr:uncharacterized protein LOC123692896 isoform X2 [Colias croceus]
MDILYDDLENYEEENIIHDLKNENKELKKKIEEYTVAINKLQKDFDKLSSEYKKLEVNYSSLLKTAKAEIERKTKIITDLNIEKDMLVIKGLQTQGRGFFNSIRNIHTGSHKSNKNAVDNQKTRSNSPVNKDAKKDEQETKVDRIKDVRDVIKISETKENILDDKSIKRSRKVMDRRKSMPAVNKILEDSKPVWSSEDENEQCNPLRHPRLSHIDQSDRRSNRTSETSSMDDRYSYNSQTSKDLRHRRKNARIHDDKHKSNFRSEPNHHRRNGSPERSTRNRGLDNYSMQHNYERQRSPPSDRYRRNKSRDRRSNYDKDSCFYDNPVNDRSEKHATKHKLPHQFHSEEPSHKKIRVDSYGEYLSGDRDRGAIYNEHIDPSTALISPDDPYRNCQSPDHFMSETNDYNKVKEIMHTAATPLEDPRISSRKYILKTENSKAVLKTTSSQDIDIRMVDKSLWKLPKVIVPDALVDKPSYHHNMSEEIVDEFYMNIQNLELDMSLESGEIGRIEDETDYGNDIVKERLKTKQSDDQTSYLEKPKEPVNKYNIPKMKNQTSTEVRTNEEYAEPMLENEGNKKLNKLNEELQDTIQTENRQLDDKICVNETTASKPFSDQESNDIDMENQASSLGTVERDLLLSDDDNMDLPTQKTSDEHKTDGSQNNTKQDTVGNVSCGEFKDKKENIEEVKEDNKSTKRKDRCREKSTKKKSVKPVSCDQTKNKVGIIKQENDAAPKSKKVKSTDNNTKTIDPVSSEESKAKGSNIKLEKVTDVLECINTKIDKLSENKSKRNTADPLPCEETKCTVGNVKQEKGLGKSTKTMKDKCSNDIKSHKYTAETVSCEESNVSNLKQEKEVEKSIKTTKDTCSDVISQKTTTKPVSCHEIKDNTVNQEIEVDDTVKTEQEKKSKKITCEVSKAGVAYLNQGQEVDNTVKTKQEKCNEKKVKKITVDTVPCKVSKVEVVNLKQEKELMKSTKTKKDSDVTAKEPKSKRNKKKLETKTAEQTKDTVTKKSKSKNEKYVKTEEIKTKFSDLFGESNSLIMPEDLGIAPAATAAVKQTVFESIFDDTQSAVDMKLVQTDGQEKVLENVQNVETGHKQNKIDINSLKMDFIDDVTLTNAKKEEQQPEDKQVHDKEVNMDRNNLYANLNPEVSMDGSNVVIISTGVQPHIDRISPSTHETEVNTQMPTKSYCFPSSFIDDVTLTNAKEEEQQPEDKQVHDKEVDMDTNNLYENLNPEVSMDGSNVVIISTGVQPHIDRISPSTHETEVNTEVPTKNYCFPVLKALATSTPLKVSVEASVHNDDDTAKNMTSQDSNIDSSNNSKTAEANDQDVPDVRIFVKRRRKVKK